MPEEYVPNASTSRSLIERVQRNDADAWSTLVRLYAEYVRALLRRHDVARDDVDDVAQEVLATVARDVINFAPREHRGAFRGWLKSIIRSRAIDHHRRRGRQVAAEGGSDALREMAEFPDATPNDDSHPAERVALMELYRRAMELARAEFEPKTWTLFERTLLQGVPAVEVAREFGVSAPSVRMAKSRILRRLRELVGEPVDEPAAS